MKPSDISENPGRIFFVCLADLPEIKQDITVKD